MRKIFTILSLLLSFFSLAQSNFSIGFSNGYKKGYCQNQGISCISPNPPIVPVPKIGENINSYEDGYSRGFEVGLNGQKSKSDNSTNSARQRYETTKADFSTEYVYKPNYNLILKTLEIKQERDEKNSEYLYDLINWILELKPLIKEQKFINRLNGEYSVLKSMERDDLSKETTQLKQRESSIRQVVSEYNIWLNEQKTYSGYHSFDNPMFEVTMYSRPSVISSEVYKCPKDSRIKIIKKTDELFYEVEINGFRGYITKSFIKFN